jgi:glycerophosphoryl diester phosphodiesterase
VTTGHKQAFVIDLRKTDASGALAKRQVLDLENLRDPALISLPGRPGDVGLGDPFRVMCESIEALHVLPGRALLLGCDNNFPNTGRNPSLADDNEFIVVKVPGLKSLN